MKRYLLFMGLWGNEIAKGWMDFYGDYDTFDEAQKIMNGQYYFGGYEWFQIVDTHRGQIITSGMKRNSRIPNKTGEL